MGVIVLHYNNPIIGKGITYSHGAANVLLFVLESLNVCAVNLFVLISGYFLAESNKRDVLKPFKLVAQVIMYSLAFYLLSVITGINNFSVRHLAEQFIPANWYVILYVALFLISPYINVLLDYLMQHGGQKLFLAILLLTFSVYPLLVDLLQEITGKEYNGLSTIGMYGSEYGYSIVNFVLMYVLGAMLHEHKIRKRTSTLALYLIIDLASIFTWSFIEYHKFDQFAYGTAYEYCNPLVIVEAVLLLEIFSRMTFQSKVINVIASASFTVYLIHGYFLPRIGIEKFASGSLPVVVLHLIASIAIIYLIGWIVDFIYKLVMKPVWAAIDKNWIRYRKYEV